LNLTENVGLKIKLNCVVVKGVNDMEVLNFVDFVKSRPINVRYAQICSYAFAFKVYRVYAI
jgi:GTP 3',8-cyclase